MMRKNILSFLAKPMRLLLGASLLLIAACTYSNRVQLTIARAPNLPHHVYDLPPLKTRAEMEQALETYVYGTMPANGQALLVERTTLDASPLGEQLIAERWHMRFQADGEAKNLIAVFVAPQTDEKVPLIIAQNFCSVRASASPLVLAPLADSKTYCEGGGFIGNHVMPYIFGRYAAGPPLAMIAQRKIAVLSFYSGDFVADNEEDGLRDLERLFPNARQSDNPIGAIAAWAFAYSRAADVALQDPRIRPDAIFTYGHSRQGKSALLAAAFDPRFAGAISHQSGTGGATLSRSQNGESVASITKNYPHWFTPRYGTPTPPLNTRPMDQHFLIALMAPRALLLGNARRDVWSDPEGAFLAAQAASPAWQAQGHTGLRATRLNDWNPQDDIAFWMRPGTHGQVEEDWPAFLDFVAAHSQQPPKQK